MPINGNHLIRRGHVIYRKTRLTLLRLSHHVALNQTTLVSFLTLLLLAITALTTTGSDVYLESRNGRRLRRDSRLQG